MTYGFVWIPCDAGAPTGNLLNDGQALTLTANRAAMSWDADAKRLYVYDSVNGWLSSPIFT
jgi:hypothetical protein